MATAELETKNGLIAPSPGFPWPTLPVSIALLTRYLAVCEERGIGYHMGGKARDLRAMPPDYREIDCSGWVRAALAVATEGKVILPDGSANQNDWCGRVGLKRCSPLACGLADGNLRICFHAPTRSEPIGHVWLVRNLSTLESWGGHGPGSRLWSAHILKVLVTDCYLVRLAVEP